MVYVLVALAILVLAYSTFMTVLYVMARDKTAKAELATKDAQAATARMEDLLKSSRSETERERAARAALQIRLSQAEQLVLECADPIVLSKRLNDFFAEDED